MPKDSNLAILFFSRSAKTEGINKSFVRDSKKQNMQLARSLIKHTRDQIHRSGFPVFEINEKLQTGSSFGERIENAFKSIFDKGFTYVIAVGNDTPQLRHAHLIQAAGSLLSAESDIVLGPAKDGGTWLMGYSREAFHHHSLQELPWKSPSLLSAILEISGEQFSISQLERFSDIDNYTSLKSFIKTNKFVTSLLTLIHLIRGILASLSFKLNREFTDALSYKFYSSLLLRAPPFSV